MNTPKLVIIRGLPGSGKSTLAKKLIEEFTADGKTVGHYEADMYWGDEYRFNLKFIGAAHAWCTASVKRSIVVFRNDITIVSNTFTTAKEFAHYLDFCHEYRINVDIYHCNGNYESIHNVPADAMIRMRNRNISKKKLESILNNEYEGLKYEIRQ